MHDKACATRGKAGQGRLPARVEALGSGCDHLEARTRLARDDPGRGRRGAPAPARAHPARRQHPRLDRGREPARADPALLLLLHDYFTIQSNLLVAVSTCLIVRDRTGSRLFRVVRLASLVGITVTGLVAAWRCLHRRTTRRAR